MANSNLESTVSFYGELRYDITRFSSHLSADHLATGPTEIFELPSTFGPIST